MAVGQDALMVLVDTTAWIDFFAGHEGGHVHVLRSYLEIGEDLCTCGVILTEVLQGIRHDRDHKRTKRLFGSLLFLPMEYATFVRAADIYRSLRRKGITVRKPVDCMIAAVAIEHDLPLLHNDRDFQHVEKHCGLRTVAVAG